MGATWQAFKPTDDDTDGLSVSRLKTELHPTFLDIDAFAQRKCVGKRPDQHYYVAVLRAGDLMSADRLGLELTPNPLEGDPGHTLIPKLDTKLPKAERNSLTLTLAREYCVQLDGPFNCEGRVGPGSTQWKG